MKKNRLLLLLCLAALTLTACQTSKPSDTAAPPAEAQDAASQSEAPAQIEAATERSAPAESAAVAQSASAVSLQDEKSRPVDLDLSTLSGTVVYSQVYDMMANPDRYTGQKVRASGTFGYYQDPDTLEEYFAVVIADATACCAQGIEFVWAGNHTYPQDYPELGAEITVTGIFGAYTEGEYTYAQLTDAELVV